MTPEDELQAAWKTYEATEAEYLRLLRAGSQRQLLGAAASQVRDAAGRCLEADNKCAFAQGNGETGSGVRTTPYYDVPEVLHTLWTDIADAYGSGPVEE